VYTNSKGILSPRNCNLIADQVVGNSIEDHIGVRVTLFILNAHVQLN